MGRQDEWPEWWRWELELGDHVHDMMQERYFNEAELRAMLADATDLRPGRPGRWVAGTRHEGRRWKVVVEPNFTTRFLVAITAFKVK
jgi:hypothetical protein